MSRPWRKPRVTPDDDPKYREFAGLNNVASAKDIGLRGLTIANNVLITDSKKIRVRPGKGSLFLAGTMQSAYVLADTLYVVNNGTLQRVASATDVRTLLAGLTGKAYCWDNVNGSAYFVNGVEAGVVRGDLYLPLRITAPVITSVVETDAGVLPNTPFNFGRDYARATWRFCATYETADGRESAPSDVYEVQASTVARLFTASIGPAYARTNVYVSEPDGTVFRLAATTSQATASVVPAQARRELLKEWYDSSPLPDGVDQIAYWEAKLYVSQYFPNEDTSVIWFSKPYSFHLYGMGEDYIVVPGRVALMLWNNKGLLIGSTQNIYLHGSDGSLDLLANYGVVPGVAGDLDAESMAYFWTTRGFCKASPFENLSEKSVGMPPGLRASTALVYLEGMQQLITITQGGGTPFNIRSSQ